MNHSFIFYIVIQLFISSYSCAMNFPVILSRCSPKLLFSDLLKNNKLTKIESILKKLQVDDPALFQTACDDLVSCISARCQSTHKDEFKDLFSKIPEGFLKMAARCVYNVHYEKPFDKHNCLALFSQPRLRIRIVSEDLENGMVGIWVHINLDGHTLINDGYAEYILPLLQSLRKHIFPLSNAWARIGSIDIGSTLLADSYQSLCPGIEIISSTACRLDSMGMGKLSLLDQHPHEEDL